ncbi:G-protein coupled receptor Mth2-like [Argiope bruennichi]|uniref:G-protein coupled receptor Mth2 like protein n=1 Tax=Argiope bruennichi TaxID=94029 RepID=A0A8T0ENS4_ARGBR|nr:G-protein coupled receptor Mth2-like [Argiope bruennichi]XP_055946320.1 G-protein coupled receptor Mth2-like [Argiope bruennichi]KAF8777011.1 G-protein coupled receptor Mth2 like protein [Argiope bruennichi]
MHVASLTHCLLLTAWLLSCNGLPLEPKNLADFKDTAISHDEEKRQYSSNCEYLDLKDVEFLEEGNVLIIAYNTTMSPTRSYITIDNVRICFNRSLELKRQILRHCTRWVYDLDEFKVLGNGSVILLSNYPQILEPGTYEFYKGKLLRCTSDDDYDENSTFIDLNPIHVTSDDESVSVTISKVGSSISIVALTAHLITFCLVPSLRNLPGCNLASLSLAFWIAYSCVIIGQIPEVLGLFCIIIGIIQQNCFLVAFFCMNVMAFDVWRTLRMATSKLTVSSENKKKTLFLIYTIYSWGVPLIITITAVILDNVKGVPSWIKPGIGEKKTCWMTNNKAKIIFFSIPAFTLFMVNAIFFVLSAFIIKNNTMKNVSDQQNQTARLNFILYVRLGLMMGVTWLFGVLASITNSTVLWYISDFLNPLQGLFIFLLFTCSRKVFKYVKQRISLRSPKTSTAEKHTCSSSDKHTTNSSIATTKETTFSSQIS